MEIKSIDSGVESIKLQGNTIWQRSIISKVKRRSAVSVSGFCQPHGGVQSKMAHIENSGALKDRILVTIAADTD